MFKFQNKPIVLYLCFKPLGMSFLLEFIKSYKKFESGLDHNLIICFKLFNNNKEINEWKKNIDIDFEQYVDLNKLNDYDIGSYFRIAEKYDKSHILFLNTYTRINANNWLRIYANHFEKNTVISATASFASRSSQFFNFFYSDQPKIKQIVRGLKCLKDFKLFPNPHLRSNGFFINSEDLLKLNFNRLKFIDKYFCHLFESGRDSLTRQLLKKKFKLKIVNSDNKSFEIPNWKDSKTYSLNLQEKLIFKDNRTDDYDKSIGELKAKLKKTNWGIY